MQHTIIYNRKYEVTGNHTNSLTDIYMYRHPSDIKIYFANYAKPFAFFFFV